MPGRNKKIKSRNRKARGQDTSVGVGGCPSDERGGEEGEEGEIGVPRRQGGSCVRRSVKLRGFPDARGPGVMLYF